MNQYWSRRIREAVPYTPGEQPKNRKFIKLNTNECPYPPSPRAAEAIRGAAGGGLRLYPDPECLDLRTAIACREGLDVSQVFCGNGSDEILAFAFQAFFDPDREVVFPSITYSFYPVYANFFGLKYREVPMNPNFSVPDDLLCGENGGVVLANPNAPTGIAVGLGVVERVLAANPNVVVIVDEAYIDFGADSAIGLIGRYPNLLVVQTSSKSRALAGLRVGWAMGSPGLIDPALCAGFYQLIYSGQAGPGGGSGGCERRRLLSGYSPPGDKNQREGRGSTKGNWLYSDSVPNKFSVLQSSGPQWKGAVGRPAGTGDFGALVEPAGYPGLASHQHRHR